MLTAPPWSLLTTTGTTVGSLDYVAPERFGTGPGDHRADIYALGCVLHEALAATRPFPVQGLPAIIKAHLNTPPPAPSALQPDLPHALDAVVARAMAKDPNDRYRTAGALAAAAREAQRGTLDHGATEPEHVSTSSATTQRAPASAVGDVRLHGLRRAAPVAGALAGLTVVLLGVVTGFVLMQTGSSGSPTEARPATERPTAATVSAAGSPAPTAFAETTSPPALLQGPSSTAAQSPTPAAVPAGVNEMCAGDGYSGDPTTTVVVTYGNASESSTDLAVRAWISGPKTVYVGPAELYNPSGRLEYAGDRTATAPDGYYWEPTLWLLPSEAGAPGAGPFGPTVAAGEYFNGSTHATDPGLVAIDPLPDGASLTGTHAAEFYWPAAPLDLHPGERRRLAVVLHDNLDRLYVRCLTVVPPA